MVIPSVIGASIGTVIVSSPGLAFSVPARISRRGSTSRRNFDKIRRKHKVPTPALS